MKDQHIDKKAVKAARKIWQDINEVSAQEAKEGCSSVINRSASTWHKWECGVSSIDPSLAKLFTLLTDIEFD